MAKLFRNVVPLLLPVLLLLHTITTSTADQSHRQRRRRHKQTPATPSPAPAAAAAAAEASNVGCVVPSEAELKKRMGRDETQAFTLHESFYQHQAFRSAGREVRLDDFRKKNRGPVDIKLFPLGTGDQRQNCTPVLRPTDEGDVIDPCPITRILNYDANRVPSVLVDGQCLRCDFCATMGKRRKPQSMKPGSEAGASDISSCRKVFYYTRVLRRTNLCDLKKQYIYEKVLEPVTVGCACRGGPVRSASNDPRIHSGRS